MDRFLAAKKQLARNARQSVILSVRCQPSIGKLYDISFLRIIPTIPAIPVPSSRKLEGSGTGDVTGT